MGMVTGLVLLAVFAGMVAMLPLAYAGWRRLTSREGDLQIWRAMRRSGVAPQDAAGQEAKMARAVRRCVLCPSIDECNHWLDSGDREGLGLFCPNERFFAELKTAKDQSKP
jgi:hypothetical protein